MTGGFLKVETPCRIEFPVEKKLNRKDVLLVSRGRFAACVFEDDQKLPCVVTSAFLILNPKNPDQLRPEYLALFFNSMQGQLLFNRLNERSTVPFVSLGKLKSVEIPVPPMDMQQKLVALEQAKQRFAQLTARKTELLNRIINQQLTTANGFK